MPNPMPSEWTQTPESSNLSKFGYHAPSQTLTVVFNNGGSYQYHGVPQSKADGLTAASSRGSYLAAHIKKVYSYEKLPSEPQLQDAPHEPGPNQAAD